MSGHFSSHIIYFMIDEMPAVTGQVSGVDGGGGGGGVRGLFQEKGGVAE